MTADPRLAETDLLDDGGYPTPAALALIRDWRGTPHTLVTDVLDPIFAAYGNARWGHRDSWNVGQHGRDGAPDAPTEANMRVEVTLVTGGWSGCESAIGALEDGLFWFAWWQTSHRGGRHDFEIPAAMWDQPMIEWPRVPDAYELGVKKAAETLPARADASSGGHAHAIIERPR